MKRNQPSGNKNRKVAAEKKRKEDELLAKLPKISSLFISKTPSATEILPSLLTEGEGEPSTSGVATTFSECSTLSGLDNQLPTDDENERTESELGPSKDPALWDTESNMLFLQSYWAKHGGSFFHSSQLHCLFSYSFHLYLVICILGPEKCQNFNVDFKSFADQQKRHFSLSHLNRTLANGSVVKRDWVVFSPKLGAVFCFACKLFGKENRQSESFITHGFKDWKNCGRAFKLHENSQNHIQACVFYKTRQKGINTIDAASLRQHEVDLKYWREVLKKVASTIKFLASRGLAFRGSDEKFGSLHNGNYLGILELLAEHDPFLANHIRLHGNKGKGINMSVTYIIQMHCSY